MNTEEFAAILNRDTAGSGALDGTNRLVDGGLQCFKDRRALIAALVTARDALDAIRYLHDRTDIVDAQDIAERALSQLPAKAAR